MTFSIPPFEEFCFPVAACNDLALATGITATHVPVRPVGCAGCVRYGVDHFGCQRVALVGDPAVYQPELLALLTPFLSNALKAQLYMRAMDLGRGVPDLAYVISGGNVAQLYGPWGKSSIGAKVITFSYDSTVDSTDPRTLPGGDRPCGVARLDGPLDGREWVIDHIDTSGITEDSGGLIAGPWSIYTMTPIEDTDLTSAATVVSIFAYTAAGMPQNPPITMPGSGTVTHGGKTFLSPGDFTDPATLPAQLLKAGPRFCAKQTTAGVAIVPGSPGTYTMISRGLGLDTLAGEPYEAAAGAGIEEHKHNLLEGGWGGVIEHYTHPTTGAARVAYIPGLEVLIKRMDGAAVDFDDPSTWPGIGPAGQQQLSTRTGLGDVPDATNDAHGRCRLDALAGGSRTAGRYEHTLGAAYREHPRYVDTTIHYPVTASGGALQTMHYGTIQWGAIDLSAYSAGTWAGILKVLRPHSYDCTGAFPEFAQRRTARILDVAPGAGTTLVIYLEHAGATLLKADGSELDVAIGGGNVALPQHYLDATTPMRCNNPGSDQAVSGDGFTDRIEAGDCLSFDNEAIPEALRGIRLAVVSVQACADPAVKAWTCPGVDPEVWSQSSDDEWYASNVATLPGIPGDYLQRADMIVVENENGFLGDFIAAASIIGLDLPFLRRATILKPGTVTITQGNPTSTDEAVDNPLIFAAAGLVYLPVNIAGQCLMVNGSLLAGGRLTSVGNFWGAFVDCLRGVMGVRTFDIQVNTVEDVSGYSLESQRIKNEGDDWGSTKVWNGAHTACTWGDGTWNYTWFLVEALTDCEVGALAEGAEIWAETPIYTRLINVMDPFGSDDLYRFPWTSAAVTEAWVETALEGLTVTRQIIEYFWSETALTGPGINSYQVRSSPDLFHVTRETVEAETGPLRFGLLGRKIVAGVPDYAALGWSEATPAASGVLSAWPAMEIVKAILDTRGLYDDYEIFAVPDNGEPAAVWEGVVGPDAMVKVFDLCKEDGTGWDDATDPGVKWLIGTITLRKCVYAAPALSGGIMGLTPDEMPLPE